MVITSTHLSLDAWHLNCFASGARIDTPPTSIIGSAALILIQIAIFANINNNNNDFIRIIPRINFAIIFVIGISSSLLKERELIPSHKATDHPLQLLLLASSFCVCAPWLCRMALELFLLFAILCHDLQLLFAKGGLLLSLNGPRLCLFLLDGLALHVMVATDRIV